METETGIAQATRLAGGFAALGRLIGASRQNVCNWCARGRPPVNKCLAIERATGVDRRKLRPDDWHDYWAKSA